MMRSTIATILILAILVEPGLSCCCFLTSAACSLFAAASAEQNTTSKLPCCHRQTEEHKRPAPERKTPGQSCPCKGDQGIDMVKLPGAAVDDSSEAARAGDCASTIVFAGTEGVLGGNGFGITVLAQTSPFLPGDGLLHVQHILRC
jgi:hypothetical protein